MTIRRLKAIHRALTSRRPLTTTAALPLPRSKVEMICQTIYETLRETRRRQEATDPCFRVRMEIPSTPLTRVTTLPNGLRVATESTLSSKMATVGVFVDAGSRLESRESNGTAHFLEHMMFKGTARRSATELEEEIESIIIDGHLNAYTSRERTAYYAKVLEKDVPHALDVLSDVLQNSTFDEKAIIRERDVILRGKKKVERQIEEVIFNGLHANAFPLSPLGRTVLGPVENIKTIGREHLLKYMSTHYIAPRMVVAASGSVKHEDFVGQVNKLFTKLPTGPTTTTPPFDWPIFTSYETRILDNEAPLAHVVIAFRGASWTDPDSLSLMILQRMLGSWNNKNAGVKQLDDFNFARSVVVRGLAESMKTFNISYKDTGLFGVYVVAKPERLNDLAYLIMREINKLRYQVPEGDVICARNQLKSSLLLHMDGTTPLAEDVGFQLLTYGRRIPYAELFARIDAVSKGQVRRVVNRFIYDKFPVIIALGPIQGLPDSHWFNRMNWRGY